MDTKLTLRIARGPFAGEEYSLPALGTCVIGRSSDCDLVLPGSPIARLASRRHCLVEQTSGGAVVRDLGSRNGTYLNGVRIGHRPGDQEPPGWPFAGRAHYLTDGDELRVGEFVFQVSLAGDASGAAEAEPACAAAD